MMKPRRDPEKRSGKMKVYVEPSEISLIERLTTSPRDRVGAHTWIDTRGCG